MEKARNIILKIIWLPVAFYETGNKSFYDLLKETKYFECFNSISEDSIADILLSNIELIDKWFEWSENKRTSGGWYLVKKDNGKYEVGKISSDGKKSQCLEYDNRRKACAAFIKREIDELREH